MRFSLLHKIKLSLTKRKGEFFIGTDILGYRPDAKANQELFRLAFTHSSVGEKSNERLEYLGDAVISLTVAEVLYEMYPKATEGFLTRTRSKIVCREHLNNVGKQLHLDQHLRLSNPMRKKMPVNLYGNCLEALVGAIYLDAGYEMASRFVKRHILGDKKHIAKSAQSEIDYKSRLLEWGQAQRKTIRFEYDGDTYQIEKDQHNFSFNVFIDNELVARGTGKNKSQAQQNAAHNTLIKIEN